MKVKWLGHACFLITAENGTRIITDPYLPKENLKYAPVNLPADIITVSHEHSDHNNVASVQGKPAILRESNVVKGIEFKAVPAFHDDIQGTRRGKIMIFCFTVDGVNICHLGDLGHMLTAKQFSDIGKVNVLLSPVGGFYTINAASAEQICDVIRPNIFIPMHYKNEVCELPITGVEEFLRGKRSVNRLDNSEIEVTPATLPRPTQIVVPLPAMKPANSTPP